MVFNWATAIMAADFFAARAPAAVDGAATGCGISFIRSQRLGFRRFLQTMRRDQSPSETVGGNCSKSRIVCQAEILPAPQLHRRIALRSRRDQAATSLEKE